MSRLIAVTVISNFQNLLIISYITSYQSRPQGIMSDQNFEWRYLENENSSFKNLKTDFHHFESCFIWESIIFYAGIPLSTQTDLRTSLKKTFMIY